MDEDMKNYFKFMTLVIALCGLTTSCGNEDEHFKTIDFDTTGITLSGPKNLNYYGEIAPKGGDVTFVATGKQKENGFLSHIVVGDFSYGVNYTDREQPLPYTLFDNEYCKVEIVSTDPHTTHIVFKSNESNQTLNYWLQFGAAYTISDIIITQSWKLNQ
jgi:hypothetical protein